MTRRRPAKPKGTECTECGLPVIVAAGMRHASCSKRCRVCYDPVLSTDPGTDPGVHAACEKKRPKD